MFSERTSSLRCFPEETSFSEGKYDIDGNFKRAEVYYAELNRTKVILFSAANETKRKTMSRAHFKERKALALAALFLKLRGGEMKHLKLVKLMYLADREAMSRWNHSITGDNFVSMKYGPVLSTVLDLIHEQAPSEKCDWAEHIVPSNSHNVKLQKEADVSALSEAEEELAREVFERYGKMNRWDLVKLTHTFPEFKQPDEENRRWPIHYQQILEAVGRSPQEAVSICKDLVATSKVRQMLAL